MEIRDHRPLLAVWTHRMFFISDVVFGCRWHDTITMLLLKLTAASTVLLEHEWPWHKRLDGLRFAHG